MNNKKEDGTETTFVVSPLINDDEELLSISNEDESISDDEKSKTLSILTLRNTVLFPGVVIPITVGRDKSIALVKDAYKNEKYIGVISQIDAKIEDPQLTDLYKIGTVAKIIKSLQMPDGNNTVIIQGTGRFKLTNITTEDPFFIGEVEYLEEEKPESNDEEFTAMVGSLKETALQIIKESPNIPSEAGIALNNIENPGFLINFIANNSSLNVQSKQAILEIGNHKNRAVVTLQYISKELQMLKMKNNIQTKVKSEIDDQQREYFLHQQLKAIKEELGENTNDLEVEELKKKGSQVKWTKEAEEKYNKEIQKLQRMNPHMPDYSIQMNYLETLVELPWNVFSKDNFDLKRAQKVLDDDHFGLEKVKERIIEYLAVLKLKSDMKSPIMCFYGPPGVGKTSLGKSIAKALGREYVRISLGGVRDEAEIRGHRKTYIGAMPGRIIKNLRKAKTSNPVFVLDEIDKLGIGNQGDPSSALLEVLDPEQNNAFYDNFMELEFDLSNVMFIATANNLSTIQPALLDRMELVEINGYLIEEKIEIAKKHLIPKQIESHGVKKDEVVFDKKVLKKIIEDYTRESGVRSLEKNIASVIRNTAKNIAMNTEYNKELEIEDVTRILGPEKTIREVYEGNDTAGIVTGLAWTPVGGEILYIEVSISRGKGMLNLTGNLGDVMKESAVLSLEYLKSNADYFKIDYFIFEEYNIHIHVPEGAIPKDGPSAGITMVTALASALTQFKVKKNIAMTGEITLRGKVLPVGGIKEKILAAKRANIKEIILSRLNQKDVLDIKESYIKGLSFHFVDTIKEVIEIALLKQKVNDSLVFKSKQKDDRNNK